MRTLREVVRRETCAWPREQRPCRPLSEPFPSEEHSDRDDECSRPCSGDGTVSDSPDTDARNFETLGGSQSRSQRARCVALRHQGYSGELRDVPLALSAGTPAAPGCDGARWGTPTTEAQAVAVHESPGGVEKAVRRVVAFGGGAGVLGVGYRSRRRRVVLVDAGL